MQTSDGRYTIVFNGEIYNYHELKKDLEDHGVCFAS
jgi:asparagine synthase (glutamine-hydrolysing)